MLHWVTETKFYKQRVEETWFHNGSCEKVWRICLLISTLWIIRVSHWLSPNECNLGLWNSTQNKEGQESHCALPWLKYHACLWDTHPIRKQCQCEQARDNLTRMMNLSHEKWLKGLQCRKHVTSNSKWLTFVNVYYRPDTLLNILQP